MATPCLVSPSNRQLSDIESPATGILSFIPTDTVGGDNTYEDVDGDSIAVTDVWLEFAVAITGVQVDFGRGSGIEHPSWLSYTVLDNGDGTGDVQINIDLDDFPLSINYCHIGIAVSDGINPEVSGVFCFDSPYEAV